MKSIFFGCLVWLCVCAQPLFAGVLFRLDGSSLREIAPLTPARWFAIDVVAEQNGQSEDVFGANRFDTFYLFGAVATVSFVTPKVGWEFSDDVSEDSSDGVFTAGIDVFQPLNADFENQIIASVNVQDDGKEFDSKVLWTVRFTAAVDPGDMPDAAALRISDGVYFYHNLQTQNDNPYVGFADVSGNAQVPEPFSMTIWCVGLIAAGGATAIRRNRAGKRCCFSESHLAA